MKPDDRPPIQKYERALKAYQKGVDALEHPLLHTYNPTGPINKDNLTPIGLPTAKSSKQALKKPPI